jgi:hypothetical protein
MNSMLRSITKPQMFRNLFALLALACAPSCVGDTAEQSGQEVSELSIGPSFYDSATPCSVGGAVMHCCPDGTAMIGAHVGENVFKCGAISGEGWGIRFLDIATARNKMHACPWGTVMVGLHVGNNWLACQSPPTPPVFEYVDSVTQDPRMHTCAIGSAMGGIHVGANLFTCDF